jgi:hypothetical protein
MFVCRLYVCCNLVTDRLLLGLASTVILDSDSRGTQDHIWTDLEPGRPGPCFMWRQCQGGSFIPPGTGLPFCRLYEFQGYGGGILNPHPDFFKINHTNKLRDLSPRANYTDRRLLAKLVQTFVDRGAKWSACRIPTVVLSDF